MNATISDLKLSAQRCKDHKDTKKDITAITFIYFFYGLLTFLTWNRWTHLYIDHGREFDIPLRILKGEHLYTDILYYYGPLSPYLNALLFKIFGIHLATLHWAGIITGALILLMIYWLSRRLMGIAESIIVGLYTVFICSANPYWGNHIQPYSYAALYGYAFAILSLCCAVKFLEAKSLKSICLGGAAIGAAIISKPELIVLASLPIIAAWIILYWPQFKISKCLKPGSASVPAGMSDSSEQLAKTCQRGRWRSQAFFSFFYCTLLVVSGYGWFVYSVPFKTLVTDNYALLSSPQLIYLSNRMRGTFLQLFEIDFYSLIQYLSFIKWMPILLIIVVGFCLVRKIDNNILLLISIFSLVAVTRIIFNIQLSSPYTPLTFATSIIVAGYVFLRNKVAVIIAIALLIYPVYYGVKVLRHYKTFEIASDRGTLMVEPYFGKPMAEAVSYTKSRLKGGDFVALLPQGTMLNFLSNQPYPLREELIVPGFVTSKREDEAISRLKTKAPPIIFIANLKTYEYMGGTFGIDYNQKLMKWIEENYTRAATFSEIKKDKYDFRDKIFFIATYKKNY